MRFPDAFWGVRCVWLRYYAVFLKSIRYYMVTTFIEPVLYLVSFGIGVGALIGEVHTQGMDISYRKFIFSGIMAQTVLFQGFFEGAYGGFVRMYYQKIFQAMATTPITLSEVLWGELLWDASKSTLAGMAVALIGVATGNFPIWSLLPLVFVCFLGSFLFSSMGLAAAAYARSIDELSYPQYLLVFPMFLFCGVFYPLESLPEIVQFAAWCLPLTSVISLVRSFSLGFPVEVHAVAISLIWLCFLTFLARRAMVSRLVK